MFHLLFLEPNFESVSPRFIYNKKKGRGRQIHLIIPIFFLQLR
jgi:hypothetical protein